MENSHLGLEPYQGGEDNILLKLLRKIWKYAFWVSLKMKTLAYICIMFSTLYSSLRKVLNKCDISYCTYLLRFSGLVETLRRFVSIQKEKRFRIISYNVWLSEEFQISWEVIIDIWDQSDHYLADIIKRGTIFQTKIF